MLDFSPLICPRRWLSLLGFLMMAAFAQPGEGAPPQGGPGGKMPDATEMAQKQLESLEDSLDLTKAQQDSLLVYLTAFHKGMQSAMQNGQQSSPQTLEKALDAKVKALLDAKSFVIYQRVMKSLRPSGGPQGGPPSRGGAGPGEGND
ncbi:MAG TPA: hypothetical protein VLM37_02960 [Fibrobacteraceae bacterium]|nr:hypothetical protein [Fibrobacteraceae bacterium]